tara:strand:- start:280 stop:996 length:717 start_codon:yes stop_codon:yes gene_type:complete
MNISFENQTVLITGASRGIGKSLFKAYSNLGANVIGTTTDKKKFINKNFLEVNFENEKSTNSFYKKIKKLKKVDILINNAGINKISSIQNLDEKSLKKILNVNLLAPILLTKIVSQKMIKRKSGSIINIGSIFGHVSKSQRSSYSAAKAGLEGFTKAASLDLAKYGILVNSVCPGFVKTDLTKKILGLNKIKQLEKEIPLGRLSSSEEIVNLIIFLSSNKNTYVTGQSFIIDGGFIVK